MSRLLCLLLLAAAVNPFIAHAQKKPVQKPNIAELENKLVIPAWAANKPLKKNTTPSNSVNGPLATCDTIVLTRQSQIDSFKILYPGCTSVKLLWIDGQGASPAITRLDSLNEIESVTQKLKITHTSISSLSALSSLVALNDTLELEYNFSQTSMGLNNLSSLGTIILNRLPALNTIAGLCNNIDSIGGVLIDSTGLTGLQGMENVVHINGYLDLRLSPITSLNALTNLRSINGYLRLERLDVFHSIGLSQLETVFGFLFAGLDNLSSLSGLSNHLTTTNLGTIWMINTGLNSLSGLENVSGCSNFYFWLNPNLTTLQGFQNVSGNIPFGMSLWGNDALTNISALSNISSISDGELDLHGNNQLADFTGLGNIINIGRRFRLYENPLVTSLAFLNPGLVIADNQNEGVEIRDNPLLELCSFTPLCNYLNNGGFGTIQNNAPGCSSIAAIQLACGNGCSGGVLKTWTGTNGSDWNDADNWLPAGVPGICDKVYIPSGALNFPLAGNSLSIGGLIIENGASLDMNGYHLICNDSLYIDGGSIYAANTIRFNNIKDPFVESASIESGNGITFNKFLGSLDFNNSSFFGNLLIVDSIDRSGHITTGGNTYNNDLTLAITSNHVSAHTFLCNSSDDYVNGNFTIAYTASGELQAGYNYHLHIEGDLNLNCNVDPSLIHLNRITFKGGRNSHIRQFGTVPVSINYLNAEKFSKTFYIIPEQNISLRNSACLSGGLIKTSSSALLVVEDNAGIVCHSSESWVWGPVKKIGDDQFTFAIGDSLKKALLTIASNPLSTTDAFTAQYFRSDPSLAGYDTSLHVPSLTAVSGKEYWILLRDHGNSRVRVNLQYEDSRSQQVPSIYSFRSSRWNGGQWLNDGALAVYRNQTEAYVTSQDSLSSYGAITFGYVLPPRIPVITITNTDSVACRGNSFKVRFTVDTLMFPSNTFTVQLSDSAGGFSNPLQLGILSSARTADSINVFIPSNLPASTNYRLRITGTAPPDTSINTLALRIKTLPSQSFTIEGPGTGCINNGIHKYYPSQKEAGVNYTWSLNGGGTLTTNQDTAFVVWTNIGTRTLTLSSSNECGTGPTVNRNITVSHPAPAASATITKNGRWLYATAPDTSQHALGYRWFRNDTLISGAGNASYYASMGGNYVVRYHNLCGNGPVSNTISFAANSVPQTINFPAIPAKTYGDSAFTINASSSSGYLVSLALISGPGSLSGNTYTITYSGTATFRATQAGDDIYDTAATVIQTLTINKKAQSINFSPIADQDLSTGSLTLNATTSSELPVIYTLQSGPATIAGNKISFTGLGTISVNVVQSGDTNFLPAAPVNRTFCVRVAELGSINGPLYVCPGQTATYRINKITGLTYSWRLSDGTVFSSNADTVSIAWGAAGSKTLVVSAIGPCGAATANDSLVVNIVTAISPGAVSNMLPANLAIDQSLPLNLSWIPGSNALSYDLYLWDSAGNQPSVPFVANLSNVSFVIPQGALAYNKTYKWRLVSKNACLETSGPIQQFRLKKLPDLLVSQVQAPGTAFSGQTITINWRVTNIGPGNTATNQSWSDAVFLSFDTIPFFNIPPNTSPAAWNQLEIPIRPLLIATRNNLTALDSGQHYDNSVSFTLPPNYGQPLYAYVITNYPNNGLIPQMSVANDTARTAIPIVVTPSPTPDFRVDTVFTPGAVFSGSTINVTYKVKNYGVLTTAGSHWMDRLYISQSPLFNINNAILLKRPRPNGTYYPNADDAVFSNTMQLLADSSYTRTVEVVVPNFISGQWFIYVQTNSGNSVYEGALANNNINNKQLQVFLTPTPQLTISNINVPLTTSSITQTLGVNWNIFNAGFNDNREKNKGHYYLVNGSCLPGNGIQLADSIGFGSSYWIDRIYISPDSTGLGSNAILMGEKPQGSLAGISDADFAPPLKCVAAGTAPATENINTSNVIKPGSLHPSNFNFTVPANLAAGNYYIYVHTNATQTVFEYPGTPQVRRSGPVLIQRPDIVPTLSLPATATAGQVVAINYSITNNGPGSVFNYLRKDKIYISNSPVFDGSAQLIDTKLYTESLPVGSSTAHSFNYTLPNSLSGTKYFFVQANYDSSFRETNYTNNTSAAAAVNIINATAIDLSVAAVTVADTVFTVYSSKIKYTVVNNGPGTTNGNWTDSIFISCSPAYNPASSYFIAARNHNETVPGGSSYTDSFSITMPFSWRIGNCFPETMYATAYFHVKANAGNQLYDTSSNNNTGGSGARILINPLVDHIVTSFTGPDTATVARPFTSSWTVRNIGYHPAVSDYISWIDKVYFTPDSIENANDIPASQFYIDSRLQRNQSYSEIQSIVPPNMPTGDYYVYLKTNAGNSIAGEKLTNNNTRFIREPSGAAKKMHVIQPLLPDLTDTILNVPPSVAAGQPLTLVYRTSNIGAGPTYPNFYSNKVYLSSDFIPGNTGDIELAARNISSVLQAGQSSTDTLRFTLNLNTLPGNYILIVKTDANNAIVESNDTNNLAFAYINIYIQQPVDLLVESIQQPDTVLLGYNIDTVKWVVANNSANAASGISSDGIYLSNNSSFDSTAILIGIKNKNISMPPLSRDSQSFRPLVNNLAEGSYYVLVKTDLLNNINELNKNNNTGSSSRKIYVKAKELALNIPEVNTLSTITRYYKLVIPDSLNGSTLLVTLRSNDSLTMRNEMYMALGYVPSPARFDYQFGTANYGNQQILLNSVVDSVYYIAIRCVSANPVVQQITLNAVKLPFALLTVQSNNGGNIGNVTVKLSGSLFTNNITARLSKPGTTIHASAIYFVNSTTAFVTFDLQGKPLGLYDVILQKPDSSNAILAGSFTITTGNNGGVLTGGGNNTGQTGNGNTPGCDPGAPGGLNSLLLTEVIVPEKVFVGWPFPIQVNYNNPANFDVPVQTRTLFNDKEVMVALTQAGLADGKTSLYLELKEPGGPPGMIRAGASGTIVIYGKTPPNTPGHTFIKFTLK
jgi:hypothetical protein